MKQLVKQNVLKLGIIVTGTPLMKIIQRVNVFSTQEYALLVLLEQPKH
jgi:hypothetical protein